VTASLTDLGTTFKLLIRIPIVGQPNMSQCLDLTAKKEDVQEFLDVLMEAEEEEGGKEKEGTPITPAGAPLAKPGG
jgi:hypothetical protein